MWMCGFLRYTFPDQYRCPLHLTASSWCTASTSAEKEKYPVQYYITPYVFIVMFPNLFLSETVYLTFMYI